MSRDESLELLDKSIGKSCPHDALIMAVNTKPTILIIHGGWHTPESYNRLTDALEVSGYEVHVPRLTSANEVRPPNTDLSTDTAFILSYAESLIRAGRTILVIAHSYGGQVASNSLCGLGLEARSAKGLRGGVSDLIYMTGYAVPEGVASESLFNTHYMGSR